MMNTASLDMKKVEPQLKEEVKEGEQPATEFTLC
jgi:hypothetical protein